MAREAGAQVRSERRQGKGHVVRRMFADVDADIYVLVDGDATYDAASAPRMIDALVSDHLDMVVGFRVDQVRAAYRPGHRTGNWMLTGFLSSVFGHAFKDILSGYRVFSRRFVKSFPVLSDGFGDRNRIERACARTGAAGDGNRDAILCTPRRIVQQAEYLARRFSDSRYHPKTVQVGKPLRFFTVYRHLPYVVSMGLAIPVPVTYPRAGPRSAAADRGAVDGVDDRGGAVDSSGLVLDTVTRGRREMKLLAYLSQPVDQQGLRR